MFSILHDSAFIMADDNALFAIEVDADDYAEPAAGDTPTVSRTYQSEEAFQAIKESYSAKIDGGKSYENLIAAIPVLAEENDVSENAEDVKHAFANGGGSKMKLSKKDIQLLHYATGEMYYERNYTGLMSLCGRARRFCEVDAKLEDSLARWTRRCEDRLAGRV